MTTNTPRTNAQEQRVVGPNAWSPHDVGAVLSDFARQLEEELNACQAEGFEQVRLNGMGGEREADLLGRVERLEREIAVKS